MLKCTCGEIKFEVVPDIIYLATITDKQELVIKDDKYQYGEDTYNKDIITCSKCNKDYDINQLIKAQEK